MKSFDSGKLINQGSYKSFQPEKLNRTWMIEDMEVLELLGKADRHLGRLDMYSECIPNINLFINMHVFKEATQSSKIEGTQTNIEEALLDEEDVPVEKRDDWKEVRNYTEAMNAAIGHLEELPFSTRLIKETHRILLQGARGAHKQPGEFRLSQNWIGGANIDTATFVPPIHNTIEELMGDLENFAHNKELHFPELLRIALIHYQFETIHPFLDGNGRVGRLMITLFLVEKEILKKPVLYLSDFLEKNRADYYGNLTLVRRDNDISRWFKFFLTGIIETAKSGVETFDRILQLQRDVDERIQSLSGRAVNAQKVVQALYENPVVVAEDVKKVTGLTKPSVYTLIGEMERVGILHEMTGAKRGRIYLFKEYINLFT
ncbi:MAG: Fic family protein [Balneolaceae bacterium]